MGLNSYFQHIPYQIKVESPHGQIRVNQNYTSLLQQIGFTTFSDIWSYAGGELIKQIKERTVSRTQFTDRFSKKDLNRQGADHAPFFYIKKHSQRLTLWQKLKSLAQPAKAFSEGEIEFNNYCKFRRKGLATAIPVVAGRKFTSFFQLDSFLITQDFSPFVELEKLILEQPESLQGKRKAILRATATYARRMHMSGMNQKDFNATHILLHGLEKSHPHVALFDLQRTDTNILNRFRWPIKALAELNFSLPHTLFSDQERLFLFTCYKEKETLSFWDRLQYQWVLKKTEKIARHSKKRGLAPKMAETL